MTAPWYDNSITSAAARSSVWSEAIAQRVDWERVTLFDSRVLGLLTERVVAGVGPAMEVGFGTREGRSDLTSTRKSRRECAAPSGTHTMWMPSRGCRVMDHPSIASVSQPATAYSDGGSLFLE